MCVYKYTYTHTHTDTHTEWSHTGAYKAVVLNPDSTFESPGGLLKQSHHPGPRHQCDPNRQPTRTISPKWAVQRNEKELWRHINLNLTLLHYLLASTFLVNYLTSLGLSFSICTARIIPTFWVTRDKMCQICDAVNVGGMAGSQGEGLRPREGLEDEEKWELRREARKSPTKPTLSCLNLIKSHVSRMVLEIQLKARGWLRKSEKFALRKACSVRKPMPPLPFFILPNHGKAYLCTTGNLALAV